MSNEMYNYLHGTNIYLYQRKDMFRVNTDTSLLGHFMKIRQQDTVLDIGTNNGALLLYASQYTKGKLIGVDVFAEACVLAKKNLEHNQISNYELICQPIQTVMIDPVDVIVCNPPYFPLSENLNDNYFLTVARHEVELSLKELCQQFYRLLKEDGRCYMVHRASRLQEIKNCIQQENLYLTRFQLAYDEKKTVAISVLLEIRKQSAPLIECEPIIIRR
ncbi:MAG: methyltransferase domain-containing protein [Erysipelotrichaceae bacterium]|nr:methyltransferase domain-containing protein [Erysipelotrichaceae bacterium]